MATQVQGFHIPEDVVHLIFEQIRAQGDRATFHTAALLSSTFLYVAQLHLFRSYTLNITDSASPCNIITLLDIIRRRPYISTFIKEFTIIDVPQPRKKATPHSYTERREENDPYLRTRHSQTHFSQNCIELFTVNRQNLLPQLCGILSSLSRINFSFQCIQLDWLALDKAVKHSLEALFSSAHLINACLNGVVNIPNSISIDIFNLYQVQLKNCHFASYSHISSLNKHTPDTGRTNYRRRLSMDLGQESSNFEQVASHWSQLQAKVPLVDVVRLSINGWYGAWDAAVVLGIFGSSIQELALSTTQLDLAFVQHQPPQSPFLYPSTYTALLPRIDSHTLGECFATNECDRPTHSPVHHPQSLPNPHVAFDQFFWFSELMSPLRPRFHLQSFKMLHKLEFDVSHWRSAIEAEANGELFWMISWLAELPLERAENIRELDIVVRVGTDFCLDNAHAMNELVGYQGWGILDMIIAHPSWRSLEKVAVTVRSRTSCLNRVEDKFRVLLEGMQKSMLPQLNTRGIVDVTYISLESAS